MRSFAFSTCLISALLSSTPSLAQTYTSCNPLTSGSCPPDSALGKSVDVDFTQGASDSFTPQGSPTYGSNGVSFTIAKSGDSPQLTSKWYLMFGHVEYVVQAAPGTGIVSSAVLQSDDLDEIDWEWLGGDDTQVQSNYFGKGQTTTYNRGEYHSASGNHDGFHTYTVDWTADQIVWQIDGTTVRVLTQADAAANQYPQTPMMIKIGAWSGGDSSNAPGTIQWAGGPTDYSAGPFTMMVKSISATDYSTGTQYTYSGTSGNWQSIQAVGGSVNSNGGSGSSAVASAAPAVTSVSSNAPMPFEGTHRDTSSTYSTPDIWPWVASATTMQTASSATPTTYPGLPSGWTVSSSGKLIPPSAAPSTSPPPPSTLSSVVSPPGSYSAGAPEVVTQYDQQGFPTVVTEPAGWSTASKSYDQQGFLVTTATITPGSPLTPVTAVGNMAADTSPSSSVSVRSATETGAANSMSTVKGLGAVCGILGGLLAL
ncbi:hypothetical protein MMC20_000782 [Loxospora ochrophaea]|nr:hypothetical protein [Loxospora ochrophaea]